MRLSLCRNRWIRAAVLAAWMIASGCQRLPYLDQSKPVPHDNLGRVALEDKEVKQADLLSSTHAAPAAQDGQAADDQRPRGAGSLADDAPAGDPDRARQLRDRPRDRLRCPGHPDRRLRADPLNTGASAGVASSLGAGTLQSVYDPAILETQIATALSNFDTAFTTSILWGNNTQPFNNGVQGGSLSLTGTKFPIVSVNDSVTLQIGPLETDRNRCDLMGIVHNVAWSYQNSSFLVWPSAYTTNLQLTLTQPLLGSAPAARPGGRPGRSASRPTAPRS